MKSRAVEAYLFLADERTDGRTDRQTDMIKPIVASQFCEFVYKG